MKKAALVSLVLALCCSPLARADEAQQGAAPPTVTDAPADGAPADKPAAPDQAKPAEGKPAAGGAPDLSFDFLDEGKKPEEKKPSALDLKRLEGLEKQVKVRRAMLVSHQIVGFATLAALAATVIIGHLNYDDKYVSGNYSLRYQPAHLGLSISTTTLFAATGALGLFAPNPYPKPIKLDTALIHKLAMIMATAGMATQIILGPIARARVGHADQAGIALGHVITGYATFAFMATGVITYMF